MKTIDYRFLREAPESERWVWLAGRLDALEGRLGGLEGVQQAHAKELYAVGRRCAARRWQGWALKGLLGALLADIVLRLLGKE